MGEPEIRAAVRFLPTMKAPPSLREGYSAKLLFERGVQYAVHLTSDAGDFAFNREVKVSLRVLDASADLSDFRAGAVFRIFEGNRLVGSGHVVARRVGESESASSAGELFVGIDVAFQKGKRLPTCVARLEGERLTPLPLRNSGRRPPAGQGNRAALDDKAVRAFANEVATWLRGVEHDTGAKIRRIAIDAPRAPCSVGCERRAAERAMDALKISCFATPTLADFKLIAERCEKHLAMKGSEGTLPHANQLWMLVGFALFEELAKSWECIEVFPQAIVHAIGGRDKGHKTTDHGRAWQLLAASRRTGWGDDTKALETALDASGYGSADDKLDAFLSAWVASLPEPRRVACGDVPHDVIWIPDVEGGGPGSYRWILKNAWLGLR